MKKKICKVCLGFGLHAMGQSSVMGPIDAEDGMPTVACGYCGASANPVQTVTTKHPNKGTKLTNTATGVHNCVQLKTYGKTVSVEFPEGTDLTEVLYTLGGCIRALGYCFDGHLEIVEEDYT
jgi:hypothetical protein